MLTGILGLERCRADPAFALLQLRACSPHLPPRPTTSDVHLGNRADQAAIAERFLSITGEDSIPIDRKHRDAWTGRRETRFVILTDELPNSGGCPVRLGALASRLQPPNCARPIAI